VTVTVTVPVPLVPVPVPVPVPPVPVPVQAPVRLGAIQIIHTTSTTRPATGTWRATWTRLITAMHAATRRQKSTSSSTRPERGGMSPFGTPRLSKAPRTRGSSTRRYGLQSQLHGTLFSSFVPYYAQRMSNAIVINGAQGMQAEWNQQDAPRPAPPRFPGVPSGTVTGPEVGPG
jgi:hypothetical protein